MITRNGLFADVPEEQWNDWHWQVRNRIETVEDLKKYIEIGLRLMQLRCRRDRLTADRILRII